MKLIGLLLCRNEQWILGASLRAALQWCDEVVVMDHASHDGTWDIVNDVTGHNPHRIHYSRYTPTEKKTLKSAHPGSRTILNPTPPAEWEADVARADEAHWDEMDVRNQMLTLGRRFGGTHFAMVDADEILTANLLGRVKEDIVSLKPREVLEYPMLAMRTLDEYQDDDTDWSHAWLSTAFADSPELNWKPDITGYHFHHRTPYGVQGISRPVKDKKDGGVMHLQFADQRRLVAKHRYYKMIEVLRWPGREPVEHVDKKYSQAIQAPKSLSRAPASWWGGYEKHLISLGDWPWHQGECEQLLMKHGPEKFKGLDLFGWPHVSENTVFKKFDHPPALPPQPFPKQESAKPAAEIARMQCSDCDSHYFAEIVQRGERWEIGEKVDPPANQTNVRRQRMLCGNCQGKGGSGDQLNNLLRRQRGADPFGLF